MPLVSQATLKLQAGEGILGDHTLGSARHVTLVFADDWELAATEAGAPGLDPIGRRANVILTGGSGARLVGARIRLGQSLLEVQGITRPCQIMDEAHPGMKDALAPDGRAGVWGVIVEGAEISVGETLEIVEEVPATEPQ